MRILIISSKYIECLCVFSSSKKNFPGVLFTIVTSFGFTMAHHFAGYYAWRNRERGSWYIEALTKVFMKYAKEEDVCAMLNRVSFLDFCAFYSRQNILPPILLLTNQRLRCKC